MKGEGTEWSEERDLRDFFMDFLRERAVREVVSSGERRWGVECEWGETLGNL